MNTIFRSIIQQLFCTDNAYLYQANNVFNNKTGSTAEQLSAAFLIGLSGQQNRKYDEAVEYLKSHLADKAYGELARFYLNGIEEINHEIEALTQRQVAFRKTLGSLENELTANLPLEQLQDKIWEVFFPEGVGVFENKQKQMEQLHNKRKVQIEKANPNPITNPAQQILFTSNVLLTIPNIKTDIADLDYSKNLKEGIRQAMNEPQRYWYDHPIQIGVDPESNEIIYGLQQLDKSLETERKRGNLKDEKAKCLLSVSVTHTGLLSVAKDYIRQELKNNAQIKNLEVYIFTEEETKRLLEEVIYQSDAKNLTDGHRKDLSQVFGVDGEYGRHYSFLKAISAVWNVFIDNNLKATFKIDLDQVFPQKELIEETGKSAFEHFKTPLWGAKGKGSNGQDVELGMIAGALVNEKDIHKGLFTPDVDFPDKVPDGESRIFFSKLLMALSTEGELMTRYSEDSDIDGKHHCLQRIHVTGGTNGILVDALRRYRPFTPTFIGRAEDQGYIMSVLADPAKKSLGYLHEDGLIMRHDKEAFAQEALKSAQLGKIAGDYIRMLYFSEYARVLSGDIEEIKEVLNPFTGSFISRIPVTVVLLRQTLKAAEFFESGETDKARRFLLENVPRLNRALQFIKGEESQLKKQVARERSGWKLFYDLLDKAEEMDDKNSKPLHNNTLKIISDSRVV